MEWPTHLPLVGGGGVSPNRLNRQGKIFSLVFISQQVVSEPGSIAWVFWLVLKMEESSGAAMIRLTSSNYSIWKLRMEDILYCKDLYAPIDGDKNKPKDMSEAEWKIMHRKTVALIRQWVDQSVFHHVS